MAFDVGSIEARMTLDRTPFQAGLREARAEAERFERDKITATIEIDSLMANTKLAHVKGYLDAIDGRRATATVHIRQTGDGPGGIGGGGGLAGLAGGAGGSAPIRPFGVPLAAFGAAGGAILAFVPLLVGGLGAITAAVTPAVAGLGAFALAIGPILKATPQFAQMAAAFKGWQASFRPEAVRLMTQVLQLVQRLLPMLSPMIRAVSGALTTLTREATRALGGPFWQQFFRWMAGEAGRAVLFFGRTIGNLARGFAELLRAFMPLGHQMQAGLLGLSRRFAEWSATVTRSRGFQQFIGYVRENGPLFLRTLGQLVRVLWDIGMAFAPLMPAFLRGIERISRLTAEFLEGRTALGQLFRVLMSGLGVLARFGGGLRVLEFQLRAMNAVIDFIGDVLQGVLDLFETLANAFYNAGRAVVMAFVNGMKNVALAPYNAAKSIVGKVVDVLPGSEPRDPSSPLRGLHHRGRALVANVARGMLSGRGEMAGAARAAFGFPFPRDTVAGFSGAGGSVVGTTYTNYHHQTVNIHGPRGHAPDFRAGAMIFADEIQRTSPGKPR